MLALFQDKILLKRREPNSNPAFEVILRNEMMKGASFADVIDLPAPFHRGDSKLLDWATCFAQKVSAKYNRFLTLLAEEGSSEEEEFQNILKYARSRHLGGIIQSKDVTVPIPQPERRYGENVDENPSGQKGAQRRKKKQARQPRKDPPALVDEN